MVLRALGEITMMESYVCIHGPPWKERFIHVISKMCTLVSSKSAETLAALSKIKHRSDNDDIISALNRFKYMYIQTVIAIK